MKSIIKNIFSCGVTVALASVLFSCEKDQNLYSGEQVPAGPNVAISSIVIPPSIEETDDKQEVKVVLDKVYGYDIHVYANAMEGMTAGSNLVHFDERAIISAGDSVGIFNIEMVSDCHHYEDVEVAIEIGARPSSNATITNPQEVKFKLTNAVPGTFDIYTTWKSNEYEEGLNDQDAYDMIDIDTYAVNADSAAAYGYDVNDPADLVYAWNFFQYASSGSAGSEHLVMTEDLPDGNYVVVGFNYASAQWGELGPMTFTVNNEWDQCGVDNNGNRDSSVIPSSDDPSYTSTGNDLLTTTFYNFDSFSKNGKDYVYGASSSARVVNKRTEIPESIKQLVRSNTFAK